MDIITHVFGKLRKRHTHIKMHDGSSNVSIMFDASLVLVS